DISWSDADLAGLSAAEQRAKIAELLGDKSKINIESGPVFHATLATLDAHRTVLALTCSAFIVDLKSLDNLGEEFLSLYSGASLNEEVLQYADFSEWQNERLKDISDESAAAARFWKEAQVDSIPALSLPFERKRTAEASEWSSVALQCPALAS